MRRLLLFAVIWSCTAFGQSHVRQNGGALLPFRSTLNCTGGGITCADDAVNFWTNVSVGDSSGIIGFGGQSFPANASINFLRPWHETITVDTNEVKLPLPRAGTLQNLTVRIFSRTSTDTLTFTVRVNGADTGITCGAAGGATLSCTDSTHTAAVNANDLVSMKAVSSGTTGTLSEIHAEVGFAPNSAASSTAGVHVFQTTINFGSSAVDRKVSTVTGLTWATAGSVINCSCASVGIVGDNDSEDCTNEGLQFSAGNLVAGTGFDLTATALDPQVGTFTANCQGL